MSTANTPPPPHAVSLGTSLGKPPWYRRTWLIAAGVLLMGIGIGFAAGATDPETTPEYKAMVAELESAEVEGGPAEAERDTAEAEREAAETEMARIVADLPAREAAISQKESALNQRADSLAAGEKALAAKEKSVKGREKAVGVVERNITRNTVSDGVYHVGTDIKAGTYKTSGGDLCYWATRSTPNGSIKSNSLSDGPQVTTVSDGEYVEFNCGDADWVLQR